MREVWVDTDFGFDDLWALLLLRHLGFKTVGVSLVAGNSPLEQVTENARRAKAAYRFDWPVWKGAEKPLKKDLETAQHVLGPKGMQSRGSGLPDTDAAPPQDGGIEAMRAWLEAGADGSRELLALGPLTNVALLLSDQPQLASRIKRLVWMGGSAGTGNQTEFAEFNAYADADALAEVLQHDIHLDIAELVACRAISYASDALTAMDTLTAELAGGYLDIALTRGRSSMPIYDPLAALALAQPDAMTFQACTVSVCTEPNERYGATAFTDVAHSKTRYVVSPGPELAQTCLSALSKEAMVGDR